jgi:hypothetical protein
MFSLQLQNTNYLKKQLKKYYKINEVQCRSHEWLEQCQAAVQLPDQAFQQVLAWYSVWKMGKIGCNILAERRSCFYRGGSLKSRNWVLTDGPWPISAPPNLGVVPSRPILRVSRMHPPISSAEVANGLQLYPCLPLCQYRHVMGWPHFSHVSYVRHIQFFLTWPSYLYHVKGKIYKVCYCGIFSSLLLLPAFKYECSTEVFILKHPQSLFFPLKSSWNSNLIKFHFVSTM